MLPLASSMQLLANPGLSSHGDKHTNDLEQSIHVLDWSFYSLTKCEYAEGPPETLPPTVAWVAQGSVRKANSQLPNRFGLFHAVHDQRGAKIWK